MSGDRLGLRLARRRASSRFGVARVTCCGPRLDSMPLALRRSISPTLRVPARTTHHPFSRRHCGVTALRATLPAPRRRSPATARSHRSNRRTWALRTNPSRPAWSAPSWADQAPLLRFASPTAYVSRVASRVHKAAGPADVPASTLLASPARAPPGQSPARTSVAAAQVAPAVFHALRRTTQWHGSNGGRSGWVVRSSPTCPTRLSAPCVGHAFVDREDATPVVIDPSYGWGRRNRRCARVTADPASRALPRRDSPPEPGHAPTRPLARCSATRILRPIAARPNEGFFPLCLVRQRSWGSRPSQV